VAENDRTENGLLLGEWTPARRGGCRVVEVVEVVEVAEVAEVVEVAGSLGQRLVGTEVRMIAGVACRVGTSRLVDPHLVRDLPCGC
jgi:hypothetical protein